MGASLQEQAHSLQGVHKKAKAVEAEIQSAADHVGVIGAVLAHELPDEVQVGDVAQAIEQTENLEQQLAESAATLADVAAELGREIKKRREVTEKLNKSEARVARLSGAKKKKDPP